MSFIELDERGTDLLIDFTYILIRLEVIEEVHPEQLTYNICGKMVNNYIEGEEMKDV